jgi:hypothetical protein
MLEFESHRDSAEGAQPPRQQVEESSQLDCEAGALGMVERMEVKVLCGACRRQPQAEGNCTRRPRAGPGIAFPARACGMEAGSRSQHRTTVNPQAGFRAWASVPANTTPNIRPWPGSSEGGGGETLLNLTPGDLLRSGNGRS